MTKATLEVEFCGVRFKNPFTLASAPPTTTGEMMMRGFEAGWGAAITKTLTVDVERTKNVTPRLASVYNPREDKRKKAFGLQNIELTTTRPLEVWLEEIKEIRTRYPEHVVIASIMSDANSPDDWRLLATRCQEAGAQMIEINLACPHGLPERGMGAAIGQDPELVARVTEWTAAACDVPILAKLTYKITDIAEAAQAAMEAGAAGLTAINTVDSISGVDLDSFIPRPTVGDKSTHGGMSGPAIKPMALRSVADVASQGYPVSATGGLWTWEDAAEFVLLGAANLQVCTLVMFEGFRVVKRLRKGLLAYMEGKRFETISDFLGGSLPHLTDHGSLSRDYKVYAHADQEMCNKCGRCFTSCNDAGYQAITWTKKQFPEFLRDKCDGCGLCVLVCPEGTIAMAERVPQERATS